MGRKSHDVSAPLLETSAKRSAERNVREKELVSQYDNITKMKSFAQVVNGTGDHIKEVEQAEKSVVTKYIVTTPSDGEDDEEESDAEYEDNSTITDGIDIEDSSGPEVDGEEQEDEDLAAFVAADDDSEAIAEVEDEDGQSDIEEVETAGVRRSKRKKQPGFFGELCTTILSSDESDEDFEADLDEEEPEAYGPSGRISAAEMNDLLQDFVANNDEMDELDESDTERYQHLDSASLVLKPVSLSADDYTVDNDQPQFVNMVRMGAEAYAPQRFSLFCFSKRDEHSVNTAAKAIKWLLSPIDVQEFFEHVYTQRAVAVHRLDTDYFQDFFSSASFYSLFQDNFLRYGENVNVANYSQGERTTHNPEGRVYSRAVRSFLDQGLSIQCVNPQSFSHNIHYLCDVLQELFNCFVGANCYYTPKGSAGFAPHFDDIDAFIVQCEGRKEWTVHAPSDEQEQWPLVSSENFTPQEMAAKAESLVYCGWLEAGDILYLPRGYVHSARTDKKHDSLHVTISVSQGTSYTDLLAKTMEKVHSDSTEQITQLRRNLPINLLDICGVADSLYENEDKFLKQLERPLQLFMQASTTGLQSAIAPAVDEIAREFMHRALPPLLTDYEKAHTIHGIGGQAPDFPPIGSTSYVRLLRKHTQRLLFEEADAAFLVHRMTNSMVHKGFPEVTIGVPEPLIPTIELLMQHYPDWDTVEELGENIETNMAAIALLYEHGLLMVRQRGEAASSTQKKTDKVKKKKKAKSQVANAQPAAPVQQSTALAKHADATAEGADSPPKKRSKKAKKRAAAAAAAEVAAAEEAAVEEEAEFLNDVLLNGEEEEAMQSEFAAPDANQRKRKRKRKSGVKHQAQ